MMTHTKLDLKLEAYQYELPPELIASRPISGRDGSRLLVYDEQTDKITHSTFKDIVNFLPKNSTVVFNHSKVFPCRIKAKKKTGGSVEVFFLEFQSETNHFHVLIKSSSKKAVGLEIVMPDESIAVITDTRADGTFTIALQSNIEQLLSQHGKIPIPPYIRGGESDEQDLVDYQTVYAKEVGSVAAPTAGLHFTQDIFNQFEQNGIQRAELALHVGMGTFAPVKSETITDHQMHSERFCISNQDRNLINNASKIIAVGTTSLRALESAWDNNQFSLEAEKWHQTNIFLHPGKEVKSIDGLLTNFHLPGSSLIMLVSAIIGREKTLSLYKEAVENKYRFFSYGDAMLILRKGRA